MSEADKTRETAPARAAPCCCWPSRCAPEPARAVLDRRYAKGELTKEQYEAMKRDLERP
jgi:putative oligomerization/nucleic acid binding protein